MKYIGVSTLKILSSQVLRDLQEPMIVSAQNVPIAALIPYQVYLQWQEIIQAAAGKREKEIDS